MATKLVEMESELLTTRAAVDAAEERAAQAGVAACEQLAARVEADDKAQRAAEAAQQAETARLELQEELSRARAQAAVAEERAARAGYMADSVDTGWIMTAWTL